MNSGALSLMSSMLISIFPERMPEINDGKPNLVQVVALSFYGFLIFYSYLCSYIAFKKDRIPGIALLFSPFSVYLSTT